MQQFEAELNDRAYLFAARPFPSDGYMNIYGMAFEVGAGVEVLNQPDYLIHLAHDEYSTGPFRWSVGPLLEMRVGFGVASIRL